VHGEQTLAALVMIEVLINVIEIILIAIVCTPTTVLQIYF